MKKNIFRELKTKSKEELMKLITEHQAELKKIMIQLNSNKLRNVMLPANKRKDIARIMTLIKEKEGKAV